jgi:mannose-6-phosphate isomerase-like protein (cupin superfamily)
VKRHPALIPFSHDHHHALVQARRLRRAAPGSEDERRAAAAAFVEFFRSDSVRHFREEEELLFPLLDPPPPLVERLLVEHVRLHSLSRRMEQGETKAATLKEAGELLEAHVRAEERELFPLLEESVPEVELTRDTGPSGPQWGIATEDLNATLLRWPPGHVVAEHLNEACDVLLVVVEGTGRADIDGVSHELAVGDPLVIAKGSRRSIQVGPGGIRYVTAHVKRPPLQIRRSVR